MILNYKFNTMLDEAKSKVDMRFNIQINNSKNNNNLKSTNSQNKDLEAIIQELKDYEKVSGTLISKLDSIDTSLNKEKDSHEIFSAVS